MGKKNDRRTQQNHLAEDFHQMSVENAELRQQIQKLKKQLGQSEDLPKKTKTKQVETDTPKCEKCSSSTVKVCYLKQGADWCFYKCTSCPHRTVGKKD